LNAKEDASKVAYIASLIRDNCLNVNIENLKLERKYFDKIKDINLPNEFNILNRLKMVSAYTGVSGRQFRRHSDIKPEHTDILSIQFLQNIILNQ